MSEALKCYQCPLKKLSDKDCGKIKTQRHNGAVRYIKVIDDRCKVDSKKEK